ncbi:S8 family serine peptidase [Micromonospora sp. NPDC005367]|uniref:S8 family peptidase n=1 Tax=Micromonospora sp. NPDC005367 TaxID=3155590 RepID=UPI00339E1919
MRRRRSSPYGALALVTVAGLLIAAGPADAATTPPMPATTSTAGTAPAEPAGQPARTLTLITGDRIESSAGRIAIVPRHGVQFLRYRHGDDEYVVPSDALGLLREDRLDERLFNVTQLLADGFDQRDGLPLIASDLTGMRGLTAQRRLASVDGFAAEIPVTDLARNWPTLRDSLRAGKLWLDGIRKPALDVSVPASGAPAVWAAGYDGSGVKVAVLDSGIDDTHPDFAGRVAAERNFVTDYETTDDDLAGHGTHVASTLAGSGAASGGRYRGMAPGADLLIGKVCFSYYGLGAACPDSAILEGLRWAAESGARVVNLSLGADDQPGVDPIEEAVNELTAKYGTLFVAAAGNSGWAPQTVGSPASADAALAVGNVDKTGVRSWDSGQGPRLGDYAVKPEITAPGTAITAARSSTADVAPPGEQYVSFSGTSMASPHVAGAAALLAQAHPDWRAGQLKSALMGAARPSATIDLFGQGAGQLDVAKALTQPVATDPPAVNFGFRSYPHDAQDVVTRPVTYRNDADAPITLRLAVTGDVPAGVITLAGSSVTVPAHGQATVQLTADTRAGGDSYGTFGGRLVATADGVSVQTPFSVFREQPSADVHLKVTARTDAPQEVVTQLGNLATGEFVVSYDSADTVRVPMGDYVVLSMGISADGTGTVLANGRMTIDRTTTLELDGRQARRVDIRLPDRDAAPVLGEVEVQHTGGPQLFAMSLAGDPGSIYTADLGSENVDGLITSVTALFARPDRGGDFTASPYTYQTGWYQTGSFVTGFTRELSERDVAKVRVGYASAAADGVGTRANYPVIPGVDYPDGFVLPRTPLPAQRTEYYAGNLGWESTFEEGVGAGADYRRVAELAAQRSDYQAGKDYTEQWNQGVFSTPMTPAFPEYPIVERRGNEFLLRLDGYADAAGHRGYSEAAGSTGKLALYRGDMLVEERAGAYAGIDVGEAGRSRYQLSYGFTQPAPARLSTRVETVWEFDSAYTETGTALPLTAVGFAPGLDDHNTAKKHGMLAVPLTFTRQAGAGKVAEVEVEASFDDGAHWTKTQVLSLPGGHTAKVKHPGRAGFVSLRARVTDSAGAVVTTTVIRAYEIR